MDDAPVRPNRFHFPPFFFSLIINVLLTLLLQSYDPRFRSNLARSLIQMVANHFQLSDDFR
jgi:hypothetical protein